MVIVKSSWIRSKCKFDHKLKILGLNWKFLHVYTHTMPPHMLKWQANDYCPCGKHPLMWLRSQALIGFGFQQVQKNKKKIKHWKKRMRNSTMLGRKDPFVTRGKVSWYWGTSLEKRIKNRGTFVNRKKGLLECRQSSRVHMVMISIPYKW